MDEYAKVVATSGLMGGTGKTSVGVIKANMAQNTPKPEMTVADALRLAINALNDVAESHKMASGVELGDATSRLHAIAADVLSDSLEQQLHGQE